MPPVPGIPLDQVAPDMSMRDLVVGVFLFPGQVLIAARAHGRWQRPLLLLVLAILCGGLFLGGATYPRLLRDTVAWADWFGGVVKEFRIDANGFAWSYPTDLPFTTRCKRWRVDFAPTNAAFAPEKGKGRERRGVWITSRRIVLWWLVPGGWLSSSDAKLVVKTAELSDSIKELARFADKQRFEGQRFGAYARRILLLGAPFYLAGTCISVAVPVLVYILLFTTMAMVLRRREMVGGFGSVLAVNLLCAVPSVCVASVYAGLRLPALDFSTVFVLSFFLYILLAFTSVKRMVGETPGP